MTAAQALRIAIDAGYSVGNVDHDAQARLVAIVDDGEYERELAKYVAKREAQRKKDFAEYAARRGWR